MNIRSLSRFFYIFIFILGISINANEELANENNKLEDIYGNSGHVGIEFSFGVNTFEYYSLRNSSYFKYLLKNDVNRFNINTNITYFSTDFNRFSFLIEANLDISTNYFSYKSFSFGIIDNIYLNNDISVNLGVMTVFEGNYNFFINLGASYYLIQTRHYYVILSDYFNILLNSVNVSNTLYIKWMYIF